MCKPYYQAKVQEYHLLGGSVFIVTCEDLMTPSQMDRETTVRFAGPGAEARAHTFAEQVKAGTEDPNDIIWQAY